MLTVRPFEGYLVAPERVHDVAAPAYDALTPAQRHTFARAHPDNYVNAMRSLEEFPATERPGLDELLARNKRNLDKLLEQGAFRYTGRPCLFVYRLRVDEHEQTGLVCETPVDEYDRGIIKKHEHTQTAREDQLARYNDVVGAASSPVCLTYTHQSELDRIVSEHVASEPVIDFISEDGVAQTIWCIDDPGAIQHIRECFTGLGQAYLTDGHHRAAAGSRFAAMRRGANPGHTGDEAYNFLLVVLFPDNQMRILAYNRHVSDLNGHTPDSLVEALSGRFRVEALSGVSPGQAAPSGPREFTMLLEGACYRLTVDAATIPPDDPVASLDIQILHERILDPYLGVADLRTDERCQAVAGAVGMEGLAERCRDNGGVAFACHPMSIRELMAVADAGLVMPPKSTWFDPKVRSGLFLRLR